MCEFLSALVVKNGDVLSHPLLDSHSDLVRYFWGSAQVSHVGANVILDASAKAHLVKLEA